MKINVCVRILAVTILFLPALAFAQGGGANPFSSGPKATNVGDVNVQNENNSIDSDGIIIKYRDGQVAAQNLSNAKPGVDVVSIGLDKVNTAVAKHGAKASFRRTLAIGAHVLKFNKVLTKAQVDALVKEIKLDPAVEYVEPNAIMRHHFVPNDTLYSTSQWHYFEPTGGVNLPKAWDISTGVGVRVAVLDTGITNHPDLNANIIGGYDFVSYVPPIGSFIGTDGNGRDSNPADPGDNYLGLESSWHGTHVAGTIAAVTSNGLGVAGVAFNAKVVPIRVLGTTLNGQGGMLEDITDGIIWAAGGAVAGVPSNPYPAKILNMSLGGNNACGPAYQSAIDAARALGALIVVSAGNSGIDAALQRPANCNGVLSVAATNQVGGRGIFTNGQSSNFGASVGIAAPGVAVHSTLNSGKGGVGAPSYASYSGTSMAAPHVAGVAALVWAKNPSFTADQVTAVLKSSARTFPGVCNQCGAGIVDAFAALNAAEFNIVPILDILLLSD
jgi:serine protease